jgi:gas vesicle protein
MGQDPSDIRAEIEDTRARVGDEVDALSYKTDVGARVGDYVDEKKQAVKSKVTGAKDSVTGTASKAVPSRQQMGRMKDTAERNPIGLAIGGAAVGFVAGLLIPSTRAEDERMGELSDRLVDAARDTAGEAMERGKQVAQEATQAAVETAKESGGEHSRELASDLQDRTQDATSAPTTSGP